jgi:hypothetical protein
MSEGILMTGFVAALIACFVPLEALANLISLGTLMVFTFVDAGVIILRLSNLAETSYDTMASKDRMKEVEIDVVKNQKRVIALLLIYTISILGSSFVLSNNSNPSSAFPLVAFSAVALICGTLIYLTPASWRRNHRSSAVLSLSSQSPHVDAYFECPCFPIVPLGGVAMNTILMGGLPLSSWLLCAVWLLCGLGIYVTYGIHHSKIGHEGSSSHSSDTDRLLKHSKDYMSTEQ